MRMMFGGGPEDVYLITDEESDLQPGAGVVLLAWASEFGDTPHPGDGPLQDLNQQPLTHITTSTGSDNRAPGAIAPFYGPDGVFSFWAGPQVGPRFLMVAKNLGELLGPIREQFLVHLSQTNGHSSRLGDLLDVADTISDAVDGSTIVRDTEAGLWVAGAAVVGGGGSGDVTLGTEQTFTAQKTFDVSTASKSAIRARALASGQTGNLFEAYSGTDTGQAGARQVTTALNHKGELRVASARTDSVAAQFRGQSGQTANIAEVTDPAGAVKSWWASNYAFYAPNLARTVTFTAATVTAGVGAYKWFNDSGVTLNVRSVRSSLKTAGSTGTTVDVNVNDVTIFTTQGNRPVIAASQTTSGRNTSMAVVQVPNGAYLTADIDIAGTGAVGLTVQIDLA